MATVFLVKYAPGEPDGVYTLCVCATEDRAKTEEIRYFIHEGYPSDQIFIEEVELLE